MALNKVMLIGNVGADPEIKYLPKDAGKMARMRIATTDKFTSKDGAQQERTEWHTVVCFGKRVDAIESYVKKGTQLYIEGHLRTDEYTAADGGKRYSTYIILEDFQFIGRKHSEEGNYMEATREMMRTQAAPAPRSAAPAQPIDDDIPF